MYVLTSQQTFSGGEEFTFDLKTQKRATIVGETTVGGAHPVQGQPAGDHFTVGVPFGRPINPITKADWEGTGIEPDVKVSAADALTTAQKPAADKLANQTKSKYNLSHKSTPAGLLALHVISGLPVIREQPVRTNLPRPLIGFLPR